MKRVLKVAVDDEPKVIEIEDGLTAMQEVVGGLVDAIRITEDIDLWVNDEGKITDLTPTLIMMKDKKVIDFVAGNGFFTGQKDGESLSLTDEQIAFLTGKISKMGLFNIGGLILELPILEME